MKSYPQINAGNNMIYKARHSGECRNPVDKLLFCYKESFFRLDSGLRRNDEADLFLIRRLV